MSLEKNKTYLALIRKRAYVGMYKYKSYYHKINQLGSNR